MPLSREQRAAAALPEGPVRVVAGPGAGKTAVISERFRRLVARGTRPDQIVVLTFTERAAAEMRRRIAETIGDDPPHVGTFHSLAMRWLREDGSAVGVHPAFGIEVGADRWIALREVMWEMGDSVLVGEERPDALVAPLLRVLERLKQELIGLDRLAAWCREAADRERASLLAAAVTLFREHERRKRRRLALDFDDVLVRAVRLLAERPPVLARYRARFPHLMVDEYQDTNRAQERLVELLAGGGSAFVVGDDDQSIYRFRGASLASMERFLNVFPEATTVRLGRNHRSTGAIVTAAAALVENNPDRIDKALVATGLIGTPVSLVECTDGAAEAEMIAHEAACRIDAGATPDGIAVLCRTNAVARPIVDELRRRGVPVRHWGAQGLYALPEVRDVIAMLRALSDPHDAVALARLLERLGGGVATGVAEIRTAGPGVAPLDALAVRHQWAAVLASLRPAVAELGASDLFFELMTRSRFLERARLDAAAVAAVTRFGDVISEFCERSTDQSLAAFLNRLDLVLLSGEDEEVPVADPEALGDVPSAVQVMTIHQAKGLEFDIVFVPGLVEGRLPQPHRGEVLDLPDEVVEPAVRGREDHVAEERRLAYVAMTRARREVIVSWAERYEGARRWRPSRFVAEIEASGRSVRRRHERAAAPVLPPAVRRRRRSGEPLTLSFSAIAAYRECPRQHWFRYQVGLPAAESMEGQFGNAIHAVLMRAGAERMRGEAVTTARLLELLEEEWRQVEFVDPRRVPALRRLAETELRAFAEGGGLARSPHLVERSFTAALDSWRLRGIIDRADELPPPTQEGGEVGIHHMGGGWRLVDYKTGSPLPASRLRRDLQLALYALGAREALGIGADGRPVELEIVYLKAARSVVVPATEALLEEARRTGAEVAEAISDGRFEPRPERRRCSFCAYRLACPAAL